MAAKWLALTAMVMCSACAGWSTIVAKQADDESEGEGDDGIVCRLEAPTGSNRRERVCYSTEPSTFEQKDQVESVMGTHSASTPPKVTNGR